MREDLALLNIDVPEPYRLVARCRCELLAVWREGYVPDRVRMALERMQQPPASVPEPYCRVVRCRCELLAVWREDYVKDLIRMALERMH